MSLDQIWSRLCKMDLLKQNVGGRTEEASPLIVAGTIKTDKGGYIRGRAKDGTPIVGKIRGKSKARELMEKARWNEKRRK